MDYTELHIELFTPEYGEVITALLSELPFESYDIEGLNWKGYIPGNEEHDWNAILSEQIPEGMIVKWSLNHIEDQNWNATWEKDYALIQIENDVVIKAPFHETPSGFEGLVVEIQPKMSFGTGHHQTTYLMARELFQWDLNNKKFLDMGAGTGVLAIIAEKKGAKNIVAVDNENWAFENMKENCDLNDCKNISCVLDEVVPNDHFDYIWANINKNILLDMAERLCDALLPKGILALSGFFAVDTEQIGMHFEALGVTCIKKQTNEDWAMMLFQK